MKANRWKAMLGIMICTGMLAGCAKTPENSLIRQKGASASKNYRSASTADTSTDGRTALAERLGASETYENEETDETGKLKIVTDAQVVLPDISKINTIAVSQHTFDQDYIDRVTKVFFEGGTIYDGDEYSGRTKAEYQELIDEQKAYIAAGNLDPYQEGTDADGNYIYDIYQTVEELEEAMAKAPDEKVLKETTPALVKGKSDEDADVTVDNGSFNGLVKMPDGSCWRYELSSRDSAPMRIQITRLEDLNEESELWQEYDSLKKNYEDVPDEEEVKEETGITLEDAVSLADEKIKALGISDVEMNQWEYQLKVRQENPLSNIGSYSRKNQVAAGYLLHYTHKTDGVSVTYTDAYGGGQESADQETWNYERLDILVSGRGIEKVYIMNQYDLGEVQTENVELLSFSEIMEIYQRMMLIQNADVLSYSDSRTYHISRIELGYARIYEPQSDGQSGLLVPVWNFFGSCDSTETTNGKSHSYTYTAPFQSWLCINAVDGSIIDPDLGY